MTTNQKLVTDIVLSILLYLLITGFVGHLYKDLAHWQILVSHTIVFGLGLFIKTRGEHLIRSKLDVMYKEMGFDKKEPK